MKYEIMSGSIKNWTWEEIIEINNKCFEVKRSKNNE
jgi:hypothetical protein